MKVILQSISGERTTTHANGEPEFIVVPEVRVGEIAPATLDMTLQALEAKMRPQFRNRTFKRSSTYVCELTSEDTLALGELRVPSGREWFPLYVEQGPLADFMAIDDE